MITAIESRRSIRKFGDAAVGRENLEKLLRAAMLAPSACNTRPWEFIVVTNRKKLDEIAVLHPYAKMCKQAAAAIIVVAIPQKGMPEGFFPQDCGAATENILLEAASMGLGTCWCGVYPKEKLIKIIASAFDIQAPKVPFNIIAVGVPGEAPQQRGFYEESKITFIE